MALTPVTLRFILFLPLLFALGIPPLFAQDIACPEGTILSHDTIVFVVSTTQQKLFPILGNFYSPSWQKTLLQVKITFSPPHRTLNYSPLTLTETLISSSGPSNPLSSGFDLIWNLTSGVFTPPTLTSAHQITYYTQTVSARPICPGDSYSLITWKTNACVSGPSPSSTLQWLTAQQRQAASRIFTQVAHGWFGTIDTDPAGNTCSHIDTRVSILPTTPITAPPNIPSTANAPGADSGPIPSMTETLSTVYAVIIGAGTTLSWPVEGTPTAIARPVENATLTSKTMVVGESYIPTAGTVRGKRFEVAVGLVFGFWVGFGVF